MCRCGLESNGAPDFAANGVCKYPLHGRIANRPAHHVDRSTSDGRALSVTGTVDETRFLFQKLRSRPPTRPRDRPGLTIIDEVTNLSGNPAELQLLYHINFGPPILDPGAKVVAPVKPWCPAIARAAEGISDLEQLPQRRGQASASRSTSFELAADADGRTQVLLKNAHATQGVSLRYSAQATALLHAVEEHAAGGRRLRHRAGAGHELSESALVRRPAEAGS